MTAIKLKDLKKGDFFTKKPLEYPTEKQVFIRGDYDRSDKKYSCYKFDDINNEQFLKGDKLVYTDFIF